jgi:ribosome-binding protein aMBF1 (putative translation factor)
MTRDKKPAKARLIPADEVFAAWREEPGYREAYDALEEEFAIMAALIKARTAASLSQTEIAKRMQTTQSVIARLEARGHRASLKTLRSYAAATGHRLRITLEPLPKAGGSESHTRSR